MMVVGQNDPTGRLARSPSPRSPELVLKEVGDTERTEAARELVTAMKPAQIRELAAPMRRKLQDFLSWNQATTEDREAILKIWHAVNDAALTNAVVELKDALRSRKNDLRRWDEPARQHVKTWYGVANEDTRRKLQERVERMLEAAIRLELPCFQPALGAQPNRAVFVFPADKAHSIYVSDGEPAGMAARDLCYALACFDDTCEARDLIRGESNARLLASKSPEDAWANAANFEGYAGKSD
jgi:hypothetical protein